MSHRPTAGRPPGADRRRTQSLTDSLYTDECGVSREDPRPGAVREAKKQNCSSRDGPWNAGRQAGRRVEGARGWVVGLGLRVAPLGCSRRDTADRHAVKRRRECSGQRGHDRPQAERHRRHGVCRRGVIGNVKSIRLANGQLLSASRSS
jgi:hypothetical protein